MALHAESGSTQSQRTSEAREILSRIEDASLTDLMSTKDLNFVLDVVPETISPRQLFWLRDILERYT